ncbi:hypothetical protein [Paraliomyxa miuraensis]|uniref:hypothetical protein n=1 Tax=Paraliomyxa miuraensis TaxID=376150 RepID=UPI00225115B0|nr:hypothetical protein [Paraliomyxa miuraensis]MCX4242720.1 hypothetical protein [Paraliomyxa miuraensis]
MSAYVDCLACAYLIRAKEPSCPFCGASQRHASAPPSRLMLGLSLGLGLSLFGCGDKEGDTANDSNPDPTYEADAVTYAGPDSWTDTSPGEDTVWGTTTTSTTHDSNDTQEADAVTYAGPDETDSIGGATTEIGSTSSSTTDMDSQEADAVTYAGPDETDTATGGTG